MIKFSNIKKSFGKKMILKGVSGEFKSGTVNLVVGASGTGKSVLMKCILGLLKSDQGKVFFDNKLTFKSIDNYSIKDIKTTLKKYKPLRYKSTIDTAR